MRLGEKKLTNFYGIAFGGAIASLVDAAAAAALLPMLGPGEQIVSVELKVNFLRPVTEGELLAQGEVLHKGGRTALAEASLFDGEGRLVAKGSATFLIQKGD
jgi:acyl-CoA thioesterase